MKNAKYLYFYSLSLISLFILLWATADLIRILFEYFFHYSPVEILRYCPTCNIMPPNYRIPLNMDDIAMRLAVILVSLPVYIFHWFKTSGDVLQSKLNECTLDEISKRKTYSQIVLVINSLTMLFGTIWIFYLILRQSFVTNVFTFTSISTPASYMFVAFFSFIYHWIVLKDADNRLEKLPAQSPVSGVMKFCGYCGTQNKNIFTFCIKCGKKLNE